MRASFILSKEGLRKSSEDNYLRIYELGVEMGKKKLLYIMKYSIDEDFNLKMKFDGQLAAFENMGFQVFYIGYDRENFYLIHKDKKKVIGKTHFAFPSYIHTLFYVQQNRLVSKLMKRMKFDYVYWRSAPCWLTTWRAAAAIKRYDGKLIYEFPTFLKTKEKPLSKMRAIFGIYAGIWQNLLDKKVDCFVMIGEDAGGQYKGKPAVNIDNGVNVADIPVRHFTPDPDHIHLLALASMSYWHGYDKLIRSIAEYKRDTQVILHMVGGNSGGSLEDWKQLAEELGVTDRVIFHGQKSGKELEELFDICDLGINSLALYRKDLYSASELKAREYAARGLPFVRSVDDKVLDEASTEEVYWIKLANDDSVPDLQEIIDFAYQMREDASVPERLHDFAQKHMTWEGQYRQVFEIFR